jgi:hypothetical protein
LEVVGAVKAISSVKSAVYEAMGSLAKNCTIHIAFRFIHDFFAVTEGSNRPDVIPADLLVKPGGSAGGDVGPRFILELILPGTREDILQGIFDSKIKVFLKLVPDILIIALRSNEAHLNLGMELLGRE